MARKTTKRSTRRRQKRNSRQRRFFSWSTLFKLLFTLAVLAGLALLFMDVHIRKQFEGKRWAVPAKVYARPLELYAGAPLSIDMLRMELRDLGYQFVSKAAQPGQAAFSSQRAIVSTRGFAFADGVEPPRQLVLDFSGAHLDAMRDSGGKSLTLVRLEPLLVGGIYPLSNEDRDLIQLQDAPETLVQALIAVEDRDFYTHSGISAKGIARAMWANLRAGRFVQGGSTLTQQLIKNFYLTSDRTLARKLLEMPMALLLELHYDKDAILEAYLNEVYLGQDGARAIHGFGLAAGFYFARPLQELALHEVALLAGLVKGPSYYDPRRHPERARQRRDLVLRMLLEQRQISEGQYRQATAAELGVVKKGTLLKEAYPAYLDLVKRQLRRNYRDEDLGSEGLRVFTSLDPSTQRQAENALVNTLDRLEQQHGIQSNSLQGSIVVTDPQTGEILAVVGDRSTRYKGFNRAVDAVRPVGSLVKPAVYLAALENGYTLASPLEDKPYSLTLPDGSHWQPQNFDRRAHGRVALIDALAQSYNLSTVHLGMALGLDKVIDTLHRLGVNRRMAAYPSLLLGAQALSPLEVTGMYQTIAAGGFQMPPRAIRTVTDSEGRSLTSYPFQLRQTVNAEHMYLLHHAMQEVTRSGTARAIQSRLPAGISVAGKTGTSDQQRDSWFAGFSANRLAVVWLGRDDNSPLPFTGSGGALRAWTDFMASQSLQSFEPLAPEGIEHAWIDRLSFRLSAEYCDNARQLPFLTGTAPRDREPCAEGPGPAQRQPDSGPLEWFRNWFR